MTKTEYREYIASEKWQQRRKEFLRWRIQCNRCELPRFLAIVAYDQDLHVHHKSYARIGCEKDDDLEPLCRRCHEMETFGSSALHTPQKYKCQFCGNSTFNSCERLCSVCEVMLGLYAGACRTEEIFFRPFGPKGYEIPVWQMLMENIVHTLEWQVSSNSAEDNFEHASEEILRVLCAREEDLR